MVKGVCTPWCHYCIDIIEVESYNLQEDANFPASSVIRVDTLFGIEDFNHNKDEFQQVVVGYKLSKGSSTVSVGRIFKRRF